MAQSFEFKDPEKDAYYRTLNALGQRGNASVGGGVGQVNKLLQQLSGQQNFGALDNEALKGINLAQGNVNDLFQNQMKGFHQNVGGGLLRQLSINRDNLVKRGLGGAAALLGDAGAGRNYNNVMGRLKDTWYTQGLEQQTGFRKQRQAVADRASSRLTNLISQLSGVSANLIQANTPTGSYLPPPPAPLRFF